MSDSMVPGKDLQRILHMTCSTPGLMPVDIAIQQLIDSIDKQRQQPVSTISIRDALGCVLAKPIYSSVNVPAQDNSAMDGYAVRVQDVEEMGTLNISQRIPAGIDPSPLEPGTVARIFTGAPVPPGADSVVMQEDTELVGEAVKFNGSFSVGANIRSAGEDIQEGQEVVAAGKPLTPQDLGLIASVGIDQVAVYQPLKIAILVSGDELLEPGEPPQGGKIYNSNGYMLAPLMAKMGFEVCYQQNVPDTFDATVEALLAASKVADVVVTTGGVSVGEEDHLKPAVEALGELSLWKVNIKPGKPFAFGSVGSTPFIGLPGNPVSVFSTLLIIALPYLRSLQGECWQMPVPIYLPAQFSTKKAGRRDEFVRVKLNLIDGATGLQKYPNQGSGVLSSAAWCDGFAHLIAGEKYQEGDKLAFFGLQQLMGR